MIAPVLRSILLTAALSASGCGFSGQPSISVEGAALTALGKESCGVDITLVLTNDDDDAVRLVQFQYDVLVDGRHVYSGRHAPSHTLPAKTSVTTQVPAVLPLGTEPVAWHVMGEVVYVSPSALAQTLLDSGVATPTAGFQGQGTTSLSSATSP